MRTNVDGPPAMDQEIRLTEFSHGGGCGGKISPEDLEVLLHSEVEPVSAALLVGNDTRDDAAIYDLGDGNGVISTTDFFKPVVDDPYTFGRIAASNAFSDVFAMGGNPIMAVAVFGWPVKLLPLETGQLVLEGGRRACLDAGVTLAGGHSVDTPEPMFGLAVTGLIRTEHIKRNSTAKPGNIIFLTKPIGVGVLTAAQQQDLLSTDHLQVAIESMCELNFLGGRLGPVPAVTAMTDVTGFGLAGHLIEICEASGVSASIDFECIPILPGIVQYLERGCLPTATAQNISSVSSKLAASSEFQRQILCDPQTNGGLLVIVDEAEEREFLATATASGQQVHAIGRIGEYRSSALVDIV